MLALPNVSSLGDKRCQKGNPCTPGSHSGPAALANAQGEQMVTQYPTQVIQHQFLMLNTFMLTFLCPILLISTHGLIQPLLTWP